MAEGLETLFFFDYGRTGAELHGQVSWILDEVIRPEFEKTVGDLGPEAWCVLCFVSGSGPSIVQSGLSRSDALSLAARLNASSSEGHWLQRDEVSAFEQ